jgi:hypothetical protein
MASNGGSYLAAHIRGRAIFGEFIEFIARAKGEKESPALRDIDLMSDYKLARNLYIFDVHKGEPTFWIRFVGNNICEFFGFDTTNRYLESLKFDENFDETIVGDQTIVQGKAPAAFMNYIAFDEPRLTKFKKGRQFVMIRLAFPLLDDQGDVVNIVGAMDFVDVEAAPAERFVQLPLSAIIED